ncbi:MAG: tRNA uridine-5-carboxymethylaminomethyl(34) synthesis enzyme MnmG [Candidatus Brocadiae bacterium]|nr:tRNA uridine-5-carboxymethylaminomethyl(34) synthesis enzyme MnmG [Candidatus Brocadiia bacterium]
MKAFDILVAGAGHAGVEAAVAAARMGCDVALLTMDKNALARMSCNPAIGGTAKGHLVHEIDALGGVMGEIADRTGIQFKILNQSKGPAIWSSRCQSDRDLYSQKALRVVENQKNLTLIEGMAIEAIEEDKKIKGIITSQGETILCKALVLTCGTFLNGILFAGLKTWEGGRYGEPPAVGLSQSLVKMGIEIGRLKTGTPPRLNGKSIDFAATKVQKGDEIPVPFSVRTDRSSFPVLPQRDCYLTYTSTKTHEILKKGFDESPLFTGRIKGVGPRYCPSIETKIVRFTDKEKHQIFLEPEGLSTDLYYVNGFSTSLPEDIQLEALHTIPGLEKAEMVRAGYAIDYDFFPAHQLEMTLESKIISSLYFAGQINGTSGYEEAGAQGIIAGINAALKIQGREEFILKRNEAYIGVLIDDLIHKPTLEPYRIFTSRAEYRLLLREDNADRRLSSYGYEFGLISSEEYENLEKLEERIEKGHEILPSIRLYAKDVNEYLQQAQTTPIESTESIVTLCKRPLVSLRCLLELTNKEKYPVAEEIIGCEKTIQQLEIELKYEGYIKRQDLNIKRFAKLENHKIPAFFDYSKIKALSNEGREKLMKMKPRTLGQASRISGVSPADISVLMVLLK